MPPGVSDMFEAEAYAPPPPPLRGKDDNVPPAPPPPPMSSTVLSAEFQLEGTAIHEAVTLVMKLTPGVSVTQDPPAPAWMASAIR